MSSDEGLSRSASKSWLSLASAPDQLAKISAVCCRGLDRLVRDLDDRQVAVQFVNAGGHTSVPEALSTWPDAFELQLAGVRVLTAIIRVSGSNRGLINETDARSFLEKANSVKSDFHREPHRRNSAADMAAQENSRLIAEAVTELQQVIGDVFQAS